MCVRCRKTEDELKAFVEEHASACPAKGSDEPCSVPEPTTNYRESAWWLLALVHACFDITLDRMDKARDLFDRPQDIPADVLREWEEHAQKAAQLLGKARYAREAQERGAVDGSRVQ
jgi:hypothetical protein